MVMKEMKNLEKIIILFLTFCLCCGCSKQISDTKVENTLSDNTNNEITNNISSDSEENGNSLGISEENNQKEISLNDTITEDFMTIKFNGYKVEDEIYPRDTSSVFMYYEDMENYKYLYVYGTIKNTGNSQIDASEILIEFTVNEKYKYSGYSVADKGVFRASDKYLEPFESADLYFVAEIPDELANQLEKCSVVFGYEDNLEDVGHYIKLTKHQYCLKVLK